MGLVGSLASLTSARLGVWRDARSLWESARQHSPEKPRVWTNLGTELVQVGFVWEAEDAFREAIRLGSLPERLRVEGPMRGRDVARLNLAVLLASQRRYEEALELAHAIQPRPALSIVTQLEDQWRVEWFTGRSFTAHSF